ncbi:MAG: hypothetical protein KAS72_05560 [Phycisphaerales bacterium]|nr:hypothetical protein [Phycisphaerales bacterium]
MRRKILTLLPWVVLVMWLGQMWGCAPTNEVAVDAVRLPDVVTENAAVPLAGVDRSHWPIHTVRVLFDGTEHRPTYATTVDLASDTARNRGEYPTAESALGLSGRGEFGLRLAEIPIAAGTVAFDLVIVPVRCVLSPPWTIQRSPQRAYERVVAPAPTSPLDAE